VATSEYDPYGNVIRSTGAAVGQCNFGYSTKYTDPDTGLIYYGHRWYDPQTGRWLSREPLGEDASVNLYTFVNNDPINNWDYLGLETMVSAEANGNVVLSLTTQGTSERIGFLGSDHMVCLNGLGLSGTVSPEALTHVLDGLDDKHMSLNDPLTQLQIQFAVDGAQLSDIRSNKVGWYSRKTELQVYNPTWEIARNNRKLETNMENTSAMLFMLIGPQLAADLVAPEALPAIYNMLTPLMNKSAAFMIDAGQGIAMGEGLLMADRSSALSLHITGALSSSTIGQADRIMAAIKSSPIGAATLRQMNTASVDLYLNFGNIPEEGGAMIAGESYNDSAIVYVLNNRTELDSAATAVHEGRHAVMSTRGINQDTQWQEFMARAREFMFINGRTPNATERSVLWNELLKYPRYVNLPYR
jgi:RHS repeat-associated protein